MRFPSPGHSGLGNQVTRAPGQCLVSADQQTGQAGCREGISLPGGLSVCGWICKRLRKNALS